MDYQLSIQHQALKNNLRFSFNPIKLNYLYSERVNLFLLKKLTFILLLLSCLGIIVSLVLLILDYSTFSSAYIFICSFVSAIIFFILNLVKNESYFLFPFSAGVVLIFLFVYTFFINPDLLKHLWEYLFTGLILISNLGIHQLLKNNKSLFGNVTRYIFWTSGLIMIYILITKENRPAFYSFELILLAIASISLIVSILLPKKESI